MILGEYERKDTRYPRRVPRQAAPHPQNRPRHLRVRRVLRVRVLRVLTARPAPGVHQVHPVRVRLGPAAQVRVHPDPHKENPCLLSRN